MSSEFVQIKKELAEVLFSDDPKMANRMSSDFLTYILKNGMVKDSWEVIIAMFMTEGLLNAYNNLLLKECAANVVRTLMSEDCVESDAQNGDGAPACSEPVDGVAKTDLEYVMSTCQVTPDELPKIPGEVYRLRESPNGPEITYKVLEDGTLYRDAGSVPAQSKGMRQVFSEDLTNDPE